MATYGEDFPLILLPFVPKSCEATFGIWNFEAQEYQSVRESEYQSVREEGIQEVKGLGKGP
jgi:hypothetical protein